MVSTEALSLKEAMFFEHLEEKKVRCLLCPRRCLIPEGKVGFCGVRKNINGELYSLIYRKASAIAVDPIEKKPLYHFYPGSAVLSYGTIGCNLHCKYCQNYHISHPKSEDFSLRETGSPEEIVNETIKRACEGVAFTYNEPTIWYEFVYETAKVVKERGFYTVYVSNGFINEEPLRKLAPHLDAANIDLKSFKEEDYVFMSKGHLQPVLNTIKILKESGVFVEITNLVVTDFNDSEEMFREISNWVVKTLGADTPLHFTRYHPDYLYTAPATPLNTLKRAYEVAKEEGVNYVYIGNTLMRKYSNTFCHKCGELLISRDGFYARKTYTFDENGKVICPSCGVFLPIIDKSRGK